jgi:hypothetical protein
MRMIRQRRGDHDDMTHPADVIQLGDLEGRGELNTQLRYLHHMYFTDEGTAREASIRAIAAGWTQDWLSRQPEPYPGWVFRAGRDVVMTRETVSLARTFFERLCDELGGTYAGWDVRRTPRHSHP